MLPVPNPARKLRTAFFTDVTYPAKHRQSVRKKQEAFEKCWAIRHCEPPHAHSPDVASGTVVRSLRIDVHDNDDNDNDNT